MDLSLNLKQIGLLAMHVAVTVAELASLTSSGNCLTLMLKVIALNFGTGIVLQHDCPGLRGWCSLFSGYL